MRTTNFTKDALSNRDFDIVTGDLNVYSDKGNHVLTIVHPVQISDKPIPKEQMTTFHSDTVLHVHAGSLFDTLEKVIVSLEQLKSGKISIFDFPIVDLIQEGNNVLDRASKIV